MKSGDSQQASLFDTSIAGRWADQVHALILTEHWGHVVEPACLWRCPFGSNDGGRAFGILQQHPDFFRDYYRESGGAPLAKFLASVDDTWTVAQIKAAATFLELNDTLPLDLEVQAYNQGLQAVRNGVRAPVYLDRFNQNLAKLRQPHP
jgi:hypothetical protein